MNRLLIYSFLALMLLVNTPALAQDADGDGVLDSEDNCLDIANGYNETNRELRQRDTNSDGYGNICDPDFDNNGGVGYSDYTTLLAQWGKTINDPDFDPDVDLDGNGGIGGTDYIIFSIYWGQAPGPSGLSCAGTIPCIADRDSDGVRNVEDNCLEEPNANQADTNGDDFGNACDPDWNNDGSVGQPDDDLLMAHWGHVNQDSTDLDLSVDGSGAVGVSSFLLLSEYWGGPPGPSGLEQDLDSDGWFDYLDNCPETPNPGQEDTDGDLVGDACNDAEDIDGDEWADDLDNCPNIPNPSQAGGEPGNACDDDLVKVAYGEKFDRTAPFSVLTDSTGKVHVLFVAGELDGQHRKSIRYLRQVGSEWVAETVRTEESGIEFLAADVASNDRPCLMWKTATSHLYGCLDGDDVLQVHPEEIPWKSSHTWYRLKLDQYDNPHILNYTHGAVADCVPNTDCLGENYKAKNHHLRYQMFNGTSWTQREHLPVRPEDAPDGDSGKGQLVIDKTTGVVYAIYGLQRQWWPCDPLECDGEDLVIAARDPITGHWGDVQTKLRGVIGEYPLEGLTSLDAVLDNSGNVHIVYLATSVDPPLKEAYYVTGPIDGVWERTSLRSNIGTGLHNSPRYEKGITIDASGVAKFGLQLFDAPNGLRYFQVSNSTPPVVSETIVYVDGEDFSNTTLTGAAGTPLIFTTAKPQEADADWGQVISYYDTSLAP